MTNAASQITGLKKWIFKKIRMWEEPPKEYKQTNEPNRITHESHHPLKGWENTELTLETLDDDIPTA